MSEKLCAGCHRPLADDTVICPTCGFTVGRENPSPYLPIGTLLSERYAVGRVLDVGGDSVRYAGYDREAGAPIVIREFFPSTLCERGDDPDVVILGGCEGTFAEYLEKFRRHARALARMRELPAMIPTYDIFEEHHTVYTISEAEEGIPLETRLAEIGGRMRWADARPLFMPLLSSLISLHAAGIYHLGLCPENLLIGTDGKLRLRGFYLPEARFASTDLTPSLPEGYAAPEQYGFDAAISGATDVYGLIATLFRVLTGMAPPAGSKRARNSNDLFLSADVARELPDQVAAVLFNGLQVIPENRIPSLKVLEDQLATAPALAALLDEEEPVEPDTAPVPTSASKSRTPLIIIAVVSALLILLGVGALIWILSGSTGDDEPESSITEPESSISMPEEDTYTIPNLVGENYYEVRNGVFNGNMTVEVEFLKYSNKEAGTILSQDPQPDTALPAESVIKVVISAGQEELEVPDVSGWKYAQARKYLEALGFEVDLVKITGSEQARGIVDRCEPEPGKTVKRGDLVTLYVSDQDPTTTTASTQPTYAEETEVTYPDWTGTVPTTTTTTATPAATTSPEQTTTTAAAE